MQPLGKVVEQRKANIQVGVKAATAFTTKAAKLFLDVMKNPKTTRNSRLQAAIAPLLYKQLCLEMVEHADCLQSIENAHSQSGVVQGRAGQGIVIAHSRPRLRLIYP